VTIAVRVRLLLAAAGLLLLAGLACLAVVATDDPSPPHTTAPAPAIDAAGPHFAYPAAFLAPLAGLAVVALAGWALTSDDPTA
jgi:hypothetical protein